jgi:hypothetical protein
MTPYLAITIFSFSLFFVSLFGVWIWSNAPAPEIKAKTKANPAARPSHVAAGDAFGARAR